MPELTADQFEHEKAQLTAIRTNIVHILGEEFAGELDAVALVDKLVRDYEQMQSQRNVALQDAQRLQGEVNRMKAAVKELSDKKK